MTDKRKACTKRANDIARRLSKQINQWAVNELIDEETIMQGMVWQHLASWLIAGAIQIAKKSGMTTDDIGNMLQDLMNAGFEMERLMRPPMEIDNERPEPSKIN